MHSLVTDCPAGTATPSANIMQLLQLSVQMVSGLLLLLSSVYIYTCRTFFM